MTCLHRPIQFSMTTPVQEFFLMKINKINIFKHFRDGFFSWQSTQIAKKKFQLLNIESENIINT